MADSAKGLQAIVRKLEKMYGRLEPPVKDPFEMILWENVAYLVDDERRETVFKMLRTLVGTRPAAILAAPQERLLEVTRLGGMHPLDRVDRLRGIAELAQQEFGGDLATVLNLPQSKAKKMLRRFPSIGDPGAEKILLFTGTQPVLALESNGLRVLLRLGYGEQKKHYSATYRSAQETAKDELPRDCGGLIRAHLLLRCHGQKTCRTSHPMCEICPVTDSCRYYRDHR